MGAYDSKDVQLAHYLTRSGILYRPQGLVAFRLFPRLSTPDQFGSFPQWTRDSLRPSAGNVQKVPGESSKGTRLALGTVGSYSCEGRTHAVTCEHELVDQGGDQLEVLQRGAEVVQDVLLTDLERRARDVTYTSVGTSFTPSPAFTNTSLSAVVSAFVIAREAVLASTGYAPNLVVMSQRVYDILLDNANVYRHSGSDARVRLAGLLGISLDQLAIAQSVNNTAQENQPATWAPTWSTQIIFTYTEQAQPSAVRPSFGYQLFWNSPKLGGSTTPQGATTIKASTDFEKGSTRVWGRFFDTLVTPCPELSAMILTGIV